MFKIMEYVDSYNYIAAWEVILEGFEFMASERLVSLTI